MSKKIGMIVFLLSMILLLSGCVGKREINELALVMAVGIDKGSEDGKVKVTAQVARPADARGQTGAPSGQTGDSIWSIEAEGDSLFEAIRNLSSFSTRRVFWAHNFIIVISEELAKEGISDVIDFFSRNPELRMKTWVVITPEQASELASTVTGLEVIPGEALNKLFNYSGISTVSPKTEMMDLLASYLNHSEQPIIARVILAKTGISNQDPDKGATIKQVQLAGAGVFKEDRLVGVLEPNETRGLLLFKEKPETGVVVVACPANDGDVSVELTYQSFDVTPNYKNDDISFQADLKTNVMVVEAGCPFSINDKKQIKKLESSINKELTKEIKTSIEKVQKEYESDVLNLGNVFQQKYPAEWLKWKDRWSDEFPNVTVNVKVQTEIESGSLLMQPTTSGKGEGE